MGSLKLLLPIVPILAIMAVLLVSGCVAPSDVTGGVVGAPCTTPADCDAGEGCIGGTCQTCPSGMVSYWTFDDSANPGEDNFDANPGTVSGATWIPSGQVNGALSFDGVDDYISIADNPSISFGHNTYDDPFSAGAWVLRETNTNYHGIIAKESDPLVSTTREWQLIALTGSNDLYAGLHDNSDTIRIARIATNALPLNEWHHVMLTYDGSGSSTGIKIYVDGVRVDDTSDDAGSYVAMEDEAVPLVIGKASALEFDGLMDEVAIFNRALTPTEINDMYTSSPHYCEVVVAPCTPGETRPCPLDQGVCAGSIETCTAEGNWPGCTAANYGPNYESPEITCDNLDNDCDGTVDGMTQSCYTGPSGTEGVGICHGGTETCTAGTWGACIGEQLPETEGTQETCWDTLDNDCNTLTDQYDPGCTIGAPRVCSLTEATDFNNNGGSDVGDNVIHKKVVVGGFNATASTQGKGCEMPLYITVQ